MYFTLAIVNDTFVLRIFLKSLTGMILGET